MSAPIVLIDLEPDKEATQARLKPGSPADILARTLFGEARGEPVRGKEAVAAVVMNRVARAKAAGSYWWGGTVEEVCRRPWQFPCWERDGQIWKFSEESRVFRVCARIARRAVAGVLDDPTGGATHYHRLGELPPWARGRLPCFEIGLLLFYKDVE